MAFEVVECVGDNLKAVGARTGRTMVERGVNRVRASAAGRVTAAMSAVENKWDARKGAHAVLSGDKRQVVGNAAAVCSLTRSCPATMLYGELEIVHSGGRVETPNV